MTLITPAGKRDFDWSPKEQSLTKTAGTGAKEQKSDKDLLFEAAQKVVKAQMVLGDDTAVDGAMGSDAPCGDLPCGEKSPCGDSAMPPPSAEEAAAIKPAGDLEGKSDAVKAVQELADKAQKAEEVATKVQDAVSKVEEAVQGVKDAVGVAAEGLEEGKEGKGDDEVVLEVEVEDEKNPEHEEGETKEEEKKERETGEEDEDKGEEKKEDEIVQKSCQAAQKKAEMKTAKNDPDDLVKTSKISPTTRKKVMSYYKDALGYDPEYCKLLVTDYEK